MPYLLGYIIGVALVAAAVALIALRVYRRATGKTRAPACASCASRDCRTTSAELSASIKACADVRNDGKGNDDEGKTDDRETLVSK